MKGRRVAVFDPRIRTTNPMTALLFTNTSGHQLEEGPVYVDEGNNASNKITFNIICIFVDGVYVGEVLMHNVKISQEAIIPYAIDRV